MERIYIVIIALITDTLLGDPAWLYHPVRLIGGVIGAVERFLRKLLPNNLLAAGFMLTAVVCGLSFFVPFYIFGFLNNVSHILSLVLEAFFCYQLIAAKCLKNEAVRVYDALKSNDILKARKYLSYIVGRGTENLDETAITKAVVETVAENTSDGVTAPILYYIIGGLPLMFLYKAVNTLDSMVGYKNDKYIYMGRFSAKTDDVFNFIPSRLTGLCVIASSAFCGFDAKNAWRIFKRDRYKHASPNSANTEAAVAGALNIQLAGNAYYFGKLYEKPFIGDKNREIEPSDIKGAVKLMYASTILMTALLCMARAAVVTFM